MKITRQKFWGIFMFALAAQVCFGKDHTVYATYGTVNGKLDGDGTFPIKYVLCEPDSCPKDLYGRPKVSNPASLTFYPNEEVMPDGSEFKYWSYDRTRDAGIAGSEILNYGHYLEFPSNTTKSLNLTIDVNDKDIYLAIHIDYFSFNVKFDGNGSTSGSMNPITGQVYTNAIKLTENKFVRTGYTFKEWALSGLDSVRFANGATVNGQDLQIKQQREVTLVAVWEANEYKVMLDAQGGSGGTEYVNAKYDAQMPTITVPQRDHYKFMGYFSVEGGKGQRYYNENGAGLVSWKGTAATTLYAYWVNITHQVTVEKSDEGDGDGSVEVKFRDAEGKEQTSAQWGSYSVPEGGSLELTAKPGTGSQFVRWNTDESANPLIKEVTGAVTYKAMFELETRTVTFVYTNEVPEEVSTNVTVKYRQSVKDEEVPSLEMVDRYPDYRFTGWAGSFSNVVENVTVAAKYEYVKLIAVFDPNLGASGGELTTNIYEKGETFGARGPLPKPIRYGYDLEGWFTKKTTGTEITAETEVTETGLKTYYAHWLAKDVSVTFDPNFKGGPESVTQQLRFGDRYDSQGGASFMRRGYDQASSWGTNETVETTFTLSSKIARVEPHTLYARWTPKGYSLAYYPTRDRETKENVEVTYGADWSGSSNVPKESGYSFTGYYTNELCTGVAYLDAEMHALGPWLWLEEEVPALYSGWTANVYRVTFNPNGGEVTPVSKAVTYGERFGDLPTPIRAGYVFGGWEYDGKTLYSDDDEYDIAGDIELVALWSANAYTVAFFGNGGTNDAYAQTFTYGEEQALMPCGFERNDFSFDGWALDPTNGVAYVDKEVVSNLTTTADGVVCLYALWKSALPPVSEYSKAVGCDTLNLVTNVPGWRVVAGEGVDGGACVKVHASDIVGPQPILNVSLPGGGVLRWKYLTNIAAAEDKKLSRYFAQVKLNGGASQLIGEEVKESVSPWQDAYYRNENEDMTVEIEWVFNRKYAGDITENDFAMIDDVRWEPFVTNDYTVGITFRRNDGTAAPADIVTNVTLLAGEEIGDWSTILPYGAEDWSTNGVDRLPETWVVTKSAAGIQLLAIHGVEPEPPEPIDPDDRADFTGIVTKDGKLAFALSAFDERFTYELLATNELSSSDWPVVRELKTKEFELEIGDAPRMFYRVRVRAKTKEN